MSSQLPSINKDFVRHIAQLARLELSEVEIESFCHEFQNILTFVSEVLKTKGNGEAWEERVQKLFELRGDTLQEGTEKELLLEQFLDKEDRFLKIKRILP